MSSEPITPKPNNSVPESIDEKLEFEWTRYEYGDEWNQWGDREIVDREYLYCADIVQPEPGKVLSEYGTRVMDCCIEHKEQHYAVFSKSYESFYAICTKVIIPEKCDVEMRAVELEGAGPSLGWEVYIRVYGGKRWHLLPNQHLRVRTAPAEEWLNAVEGSILPVLMAREADAVEELRVHEEKMGVRLEDVALDEAQVWFWAYSSVVNCDIDEVRANLKRTESRWEAVKMQLNNHLEAEKEMGLSLYAPWIGIPHWLKTRHYRNEAAETEMAFLTVQEQWRALQRLTDEPKIQTEIEEKALQMQRAQESRIEIQAVSSQIRKAEELAGYLRERKGFPVTLEESAIAGRRLETVPRMITSELFTQRENACLGIRM